MWKIKTKVNFDFSKAVKQLDKTFEKIFDAVGKKAVKSMRDTINNHGYGQYSAPNQGRLSDVRRINRQRGIWFPDPPRGSLVTATSDDTPLKQTGRLYKSMEVKKDGIHMMDYSIAHNDGKKDKVYPDVGRMPKREFINIGLEDVNLDKLADETIDQISKSIESKWKISK
mgnify:FL=1|tara:strand:- start:394 stop:903 length:510 start_codon:yes stop_codon:yes gene_type:complete